MAYVKITELTELVTTAGEDVLIIVDDPSGVPVTKKVTLNNLIPNGGIDEDSLSTSVAGDGLTGGLGTPLAVSVDDTTIEISGDALQLKASGLPFIFNKRQGSDSTDWDDNGTTDYDTGNVKMFIGNVTVTIPIGGESADYHITYPSAFTGTPLVFAVAEYSVGFTKPVTAGASLDGANPYTKAYIRAGRPEGQATTATQDVSVMWLAIGPA